MNKEYTLQLNDALKGGLCESTVIQLIKITISHIGHEVTWEDFEDYFASKIPEDDEIFENLHSLIFSHFESLEKSEESIDTDLVKLSFESPQVVQAFYAFTQHSFPIINDEYPKLDNQEIILTADQLFFCRRGAKLKTGELPSDFLSDYFLKTLRADEYDFSDKFIKSLFPKADGSRYLQNLRPRNREPYTISGDGSIISRAERTALSKPKNDGYTQIQSHTLLDTKALTPVFGFNKDRNPKLYGILTHQQDLIISRLLLNDGGTVGRPFDAVALPRGEQISSEYRNSSKTVLFHHSEFEKFKSENIKTRKQQGNTNEILARIKFNIFRAMVCICGDILSSRLLAVDFLNELIEHFSRFSKTTKIQINPKFKLPIVFYLKKSGPEKFNRSIDGIIGNNALHNISILTRKKINKDSKRAIYLNKVASSRSRFDNMHYEYLLGIEEVTPQLLLRKDVSGKPLALHILRKGHTRLLLRLIRPSRTQRAQIPTKSSGKSTSALSEAIFNSLIAYNCFTQNDIIISQLIMAEAFDEADRIIAATKSDKHALSYEVDNGKSKKLVNLRDHIAGIGNPRHFQYMGLDQMLPLVAKKRYWVAMRLCLKEFPNIPTDMLDKLFISVCAEMTYAKAPEIIFFIKKTNISSVAIQKAIRNAISQNDWSLIELLSIYCISETNLLLDLILSAATQGNKSKVILMILERIAKSDCRRVSFANNYFSSLMSCIQFELNELLPAIFDYERANHDQYTIARLGLARSLAYALNKTAAIAFFDRKNSELAFSTSVNTRKDFCYQIFEALFANLPIVAEYRLRSAEKKLQLSFPKNTNFIDKFLTFSDVFEDTLNDYKDLIRHPITVCLSNFFKSLTELSLKYHNQDLLNRLTSIFTVKQKISETEIVSIIIASCLNNLTPNNVSLVIQMVENSSAIHFWKTRILKNFEHGISNMYPYNRQSSLLFYLLLSIRDKEDNLLLDPPLVKKAYEYAIRKKNTVLTTMIIRDTPLSEPMKEEVLLFAFDNTQTRYIHYLLTHFDFTITKQHLHHSFEYAHHWVIAVLLRELTKERYKNAFSPMDYFKLWCNFSTNSPRRFSTTEVRKLLISILEPHIIKHFTLMTFILLLQKSQYGESLGFAPYSFHSNVWSLLCRPEMSLKLFSPLPQYLYNLDESCRKRIIDSLNDYFEDPDTIPAVATINETYQTILRILYNSKPSTFQTLFFRRNTNTQFTQNPFSYEAYQYLHEVNELLKQHQKVAFTPESLEIDHTIHSLYSEQKI